MSESVVSHFFSSFFPPVFCFILGAPLLSGRRCDCQVRGEQKPARLSLDKRIFFPLSPPPPPPPWFEDISAGSSGEAGINAGAGVGLGSLIRRRNRGYSQNCQAAASFQRDGAAGGGERA